MKFSKTTLGFYDERITPNASIPSDAVSISDETHAALLDGESSGKLIIADSNGNPVLVSRPAPSLSDLKATKLSELDAAYSTAIQQPIAYMGTTFQADPDSRALMNEAITGLQAVLAVGGTVPPDFAWWDSNNNPVPMTLLQLQGLYATGTLAVNTAFKNKRAKKDAANSATTVAQVQAIVW